MKLFYTFLLCISLNTIFAQVPTSERNALIDFYNATNGDNWLNSTNWNTSNPVSTWLGVTTTVITGQEHVTRLEFDNNNLRPNINSSISNLPQLKAFWVTNTNISFGSSNSIPSSIGSLANLEEFWVSNWNLQGTLPNSIGNLNNLDIFVLRGTSVGGTIPNSFTTMSSLTSLSLNGNNFSGTVPNFTSTGLNFFRIQNNAFQFGDFENQHASYVANIGSYTFSPQALVDTPQDIALNLGETHTFTTNTSGNNNTYWWYKDGVYTGFQGNSYTVTINSSVDYGVYFYIVTNSIITGFNLQSNNFVIGNLPENHPDYNNLVAIYNALDGPNWNTTWDITTPIHSWHGLTFDNVTDRILRLQLTGNNLTGTIPAEIGNLTTLTTLDLNTNNINGLIPVEIGNLTQLTDLWLLSNNITGEIPAEIWTLTNLVNLIIGYQGERTTPYDIGSMTLTNGIPPEISNLQNLEWLNLSTVALSQPLQPEMFNLPNLKILRLISCGLTGTLPIEFSGIANLRIHENEFEGAIPQEILDATFATFHGIYLEGNYFDFSDLEPLVLSNNFDSITYSPQRTRDIPEDVAFAPGSDITLNVDDTDIGRTTTKAVNNVYQWFKDNAVISGANQNSYTIINAQVADSGIYFCEITNTLLPDLIIRRANINVLVDPSVSVNDSLLTNLIIYPNPTQDNINIKFNYLNNENLSASLYDITGRLVLSKKLNSNLNQINLNNLSSGVYLLKIKSEKAFITKQIIKK